MLTSLKSLLTSIVDYAGLFPPAQLSLPEAASIYDRAKASPDRWMLDRFVIPAVRLSDLHHTLTTLTERQSSTPWSLSVILSPNWAAELAQLQTIQPWTQDQIEAPIAIAAWEVAPLPPAEIPQVCQQLPSQVPVFFEIPFQAELEPYLNGLHQMNAAAKLRTGGTIPAAFPDNKQLSQRILALSEAQISFKATAGLHHPLPGQHHLSDQPDRSVATMHGFLNVAILAAFAYQKKMLLDEAIALLETASITQFQFTDTELTWRDRTLSTTEIMRSRQQFFHSFGSCSFQDPITDLHSLHLL